MGLLTPDDNASDICYRNLMGDEDWAQNARVYLEELYALTSDVLDTKFSQQAKADLHSCFAEMYFAAVCRHRLSLCISHPSDKGFDFFLNDLNCWVECVTPSHGNALLASENTVPVSECWVGYEFPKRQYLLRLSSVFTVKSEKALNDINKGLIHKDQPIVIFVSAGAMQDRFSFWLHPPMFNVLLGLGEMRFLVDKTGIKSEVEYEYKNFVEKVGAKENIEIGYFFDYAYSHISAVIYSWADFANPIDSSLLGDDFFILHNPLAKNKLSYGSISCGKEFYINLGSDNYSIVRFRD